MNSRTKSMSRIYKITTLLFAFTYPVGCTISARNVEARLRLAACEGRVEVVRELVKTRGDINAKGSTGDTMLSCSTHATNLWPRPASLSTTIPRPGSSSGETTHR